MYSALSPSRADDAIEAKRREMEENASVMAEYWVENQNSDAGSAEPDGFVSLDKLDSEEEEEEGSEGEEEGSEEEGSEEEGSEEEGNEEGSRRMKTMRMKTVRSRKTNLLEQ
jgi:hypothetical protein